MTEDPTCDGVIAFGQMGGEHAAVLLSPIADSAPEDVREGLARRNLVNMGHRCPCGALLTLPNRAARRAANRRGQTLNVTVEHQPDCPATTENLRAAIARWRS